MAEPPPTVGIASPRAVLAADIGGTKLAAGVVSPEGNILARRFAATPTDVDGETLFAALVALLEAARDGAGRPPLGALGVGCGGPMEWAAGRVTPLNIPAWRSFPLAARLEERFGLPVRLDNDAKAMALGEFWRGAGRGAACLLGMVVSTGVGGGIVSAGRLLHGASGNAGHIGHVIAEPEGPRCACGARGCVEAIASGPSLVRLARAALAAGEPSRLAETGPDRLTAVEIAAAAAAGDGLALRLFARAGRALGIAIASAAALLDLDRVVVGGGVSGAGALLFDPLREEYAARADLAFTRRLVVLPSALGPDAGWLGAAALWLAPST